MDMSRDDVERFAVAALAIFAGSQELSDAFPKELDRSKRATDEVTAELGAARLAVSSSKVRGEYEDAERALQVLYERNLALAVRVSERLSARLKPARDPGVSGDAVVSSFTSAVQAGLKGGLDEQVADLQKFGLAISQFFVGATLAGLDGSVGRAIDTCEAFLGREVGSHEYKKRSSKVLMTFLNDAAGVVTKFAFLATVLEAIRQIRYSPQAEGQQTAIRNAQGAEKLELFTKEVTVLGAEAMDYAEGIIGTSIDAVEESQIVPPFAIFSIATG
jgi:hypothetical protein